MSTLRAWWSDEARDAPARQWLLGAALPVDRQLNSVTAYTISSLICRLLGINPPMRAHVPGPDGLPGGITKQAVVAFNMAAVTFDGVAIEAGGLCPGHPVLHP